VLPISGSQIGQLLGAAGGCGDHVAGFQRGTDQFATEPARRSRDEPNLSCCPPIYFATVLGVSSGISVSRDPPGAENRTQVSHFVDADRDRGGREVLTDVLTMSCSHYLIV